MRKTYMMLLALVLSVLGTTAASAQKIYRAELDKSMFKAWDGYLPGANEVEAEPIDDGAATFNCENNLYKQLAAGTVVFGNTNVYYLWYADLTGTKTFYAEGTPGLQLRVQMNRPEPIEPGSDGYDAHGGSTVVRMLVIGEDGKGSIDVSDLEYVHLNCIKTNWGDTGVGVVKNFYMEGTVRPVTGILSMINNGDAEGDDLSSFPVSLDGPNNGDSAPDSPEIVEGEGVDGSRCFKVTSVENPTEAWHTQFYIKADEVMPKGTKWKLKMAVKASENARITTSAQAQPRQWKGDMGISEFGATTEWKTLEWSGEIGVDDFQSIAFDLSNGDDEVSNTKGDGTAKVNHGISFYFDNIEFGVDLGGSNPMNSIALAFGYDVIRVDLGGLTNMKKLVSDAPTKTLVYDNSAVTLTVDGEPFDAIASVEGYNDGNLYIFVNEDLDPESEVKVAFTNPADDAHRLLFTSGKWEGEAVPDFSGIIAPFDEVLAEAGLVSYVYGEPALVEISPEAGSFNLPADFKEITVTFNQPVLVTSVVAKLGAEALTPSGVGEDEYSKVIKLTRTSDAALEGAKDLVISAAEGKAGADYGLQEPIVVKYSFGPVTSDAKPEVLFTDNFGADSKNNYVPDGWVINSDAEEREAGDYGNGGCRVIVGGGGDNGFVKAIAYICSRGVNGDVEVPGRAYYGAQEGYELTLTPRKYTLTLGAARWDSNGTERQLKVQVCKEDGDVIVEETKAVEPDYKSSKDATRFSIEFEIEETTNVVLKFIPLNMNGEPGGYGDACAIGDIKLQFIPDVLGVVESELLADALTNAKVERDEDTDARYAGETYTALVDLINEVEANMGSYSAPSVYVAKADALTAATKAMADHVALCKEYDKLPEQAFNLWIEKKDSKFVNTEYFKNLDAAVNKYCTYENENQFNEETGEEYSTLVLKDFVKYYATAELTAAKDELSNVITLASKWLTEGPSTKGWNQITTGYAALHERIRRGVELLKSLGVADNDPQIVWAEAELGDNDEIAEAIVFRAKKLILADLAKGAESTLFATDGDEGETPSYDLSVFFKNPNCYGPANSTEVPGWTSVQGNCFAWSSWDAAQNHSASTPYPEDCDIHAGWHPNPYAMVEQTVTDLPAGVYVVTVKCNDNGNSWNASDAEADAGSSTCAYVRTSANPAIEAGAAVDRESDFAMYLTGSGDFVDGDSGEGLTIEDGQLTVGFYYGNTSQAFFEEITSVKLVAPVENHNYKKDQETSIETAAAPSVRALQVYDLNGRRVIKANKGLVIVKKQMSDGSVRVEKVVK